MDAPLRLRPSLLSARPGAARPRGESVSPSVSGSLPWLLGAVRCLPDAQLEEGLVAHSLRSPIGSGSSDASEAGMRFDVKSVISGSDAVAGGALLAINGHGDFGWIRIGLYLIAQCLLKFLMRVWLRGIEPGLIHVVAQFTL